MTHRVFLGCASVALILAGNAPASVLTYGDVDCLGFACYAAVDPTAGAMLQGLSDGVVTQASNNFGHGFPFSPDAGDFAGTDQIYVGSVQTAAHDGYSQASQRINGPDILVMNYASWSGRARSSLL